MKEAVWKALQLPIAHLVWRDIVVTRQGAAMGVSLSGIVLAEAEANRVASIHVTTAVRDHLVIATALVESR